MMAQLQASQSQEQMIQARRMAAHDKALEEIRDTMVVMTEIERRLSAVQKDQTIWLEHISKNLSETSDKLIAATTVVAEIGDKLNGLIGYLDGLPKKPPQEPIQ